jgi:hypothetical protein
LLISSSFKKDGFHQAARQHTTHKSRASSSDKLEKTNLQSIYTKEQTVKMVYEATISQSTETSLGAETSFAGIHSWKLR